MEQLFDTKIEYLKGVGERSGRLLREELRISTFGDLLQHYPFRHEDRSTFHRISEVHEDMPYIQLIGRIQSMETVGEGAKQRLVACLSDGTGVLELVWFQGSKWIASKLKLQTDYLVFGKPNRFGSKYSIAHPEIDLWIPHQQENKPLQPVYATTEKLKRSRIDSKALAKLQQRLLGAVLEKIPETLPAHLIGQYQFISKREAMRHIHFPESLESLEKARARLKFEELFYVQLRILKLKLAKTEKSPGRY